MDATIVLRNSRVFAPLTILATLLLASAVVLVVARYAGAATFTVNSTADRVDANVGDGVCRTSAGTCTLRAAIQRRMLSPAPIRSGFPRGPTR
jgi:CSLREA domain-containing protein